jgi:outer membrane protein assembly factor BamB
MRNPPTLLVITLLIIIALSFTASIFTLTTQADQDYANQQSPASTGNTYRVNLPYVATTAESSWPMAGANPERTSWIEEEIPGNLKPVWYKTFEPYILPRTQIVAVNGVLFIATARGMYAVDAQTGDEVWVYPTELPLADTPTYDNGVIYIGGFDKKLHAIDAVTGQGLWTFDGAAQGYQVNPLVVNGVVYLGNRDGNFYAVGAHNNTANQGKLIWKYQTEGPILYSAAYKDNTVYFAANDSHAYALDAHKGKLVWKSEKLPGAGFHSWWPVIYEGYVIFSGSGSYRNISQPFGGALQNKLEKEDVYLDYNDLPRGTFVGPELESSPAWARGYTVLDLSKPNIVPEGRTKAVTQYYAEKPWRRTYFVLDRENGHEITYNFNNLGKPEYAPLLWFGTHGGNRHPPAVGPDGLLYQSVNYRSDRSIPGGHIAAWKPDTPYIMILTDGWNAVDEPQGYAGGGRLIYWNRCCDRVGQSLPISQEVQGGRYYTYNNGNGASLIEMMPDYMKMYHNPDGGIFITSPFASFHTNGAYGWHGDTTAPIPHQGMVYTHRSNALIAFGHIDSGPVTVPDAKIHTVANADRIPTKEELQTALNREVQKMLAAGHLRPGYLVSGIFDSQTRFCGDDLQDYWHHPADTIITLSRVIPHVSPETREQVENYLQDEFNGFPPYEYNHIGWQGAAREIYDTPPEVSEAMAGIGPTQQNYNWNFPGWRSSPIALYGLWKYAEVFPGEAKLIFDTAKTKSRLMDSFNNVPDDEILTELPHVNNAFIAGYLGYLKLEQMAGYPETSSVRFEYERLLQLRVDTFSRESPWADLGRQKSKNYCRALNVSRNFIFLVPELAEYLGIHAHEKVKEAIIEYQEIAPYWFVAKAEVEFAEGVIKNLYDYHALFQAKALILKEPYEELAKYVDVPAFEIGDLHYIDNLVSALEADSTGTIQLDVEPGWVETPSLTQRVNAPYNVPFSERAIFWLGQVDMTANHASVRVGYGDDELTVYAHVFDRQLWYNTSPSAESLAQWDAVTILLNLDGNVGNKPMTNAFKFVAQFNPTGRENSNYQAAYRGDGTGWAPIAATSFAADTGWRGSGYNNEAESRGWWIKFTIPFSTVGLSEKPEFGETWGLAVLIHDRDDEAGTSIPDQSWPKEVQVDAPSTWGKLRFGLPNYIPPFAIDHHHVTIRHGVDGASVVDGHVGGSSNCGQGLDYWNEWGQTNYDGAKQVNIQNQWDVADWPCYSRYYITFPLEMIPPGKVIVSARLTLYQVGNAGQGWDPGPEPSLIQALTISEEWDEFEIAWNNAPLALENVSAAWVYPVDENTGWPGVARQWNVSYAVADAYEREQPLRLAMYAADSAYHSGKYFYSSSAGEAARPQLNLTWGDPAVATAWVYLPLVNR